MAFKIFSGLPVISFAAITSGPVIQMGFYEKVIKVKADVAALLTFLVLCGFRHISGENFALGSLRSDDWQLGRPTAPPLLSVFRVFSPPNASSLPCCIELGTKRNAVQLGFVP